ncbi:hypothetical protein SAMN06265173_11547 [Thalassovita litoralis]|uniref:Polysaccharide biosynthesis protein n=1 Tax=Thalassovita litoralis TaxID=1010611 RepID=A0A521EAW7_9RHOB|nr:hypothetical protein [Thalassovita litoralis]SMO80922.1 hypothetical protein SAMN06265173_11547 [Thalassovita litoralis]
MLNRGVTTLRAMSAAMVTQAFGSLTNFVFNFYLMRTMVFEEFGLFGIGFAIVMVLNGFWQGFFTTQYIVLAPGEDHVRFPAQVYAAMMLTSAGAAALVVATAAVLQHFAGIGLFVLGIGFSAIAFSLKEFHIRCAFSAGMSLSLSIICLQAGKML